MSVMLSGSDLSVTDVVRVARGRARVELDPEARDRMASARAVVDAALRSGEPVYGLTTGVAERKRVLLDPEERRSVNVRLVHNHRIAQGALAPADVVRGAMLCLANSYAKGVTGVRPELCEMIIDSLNSGVTPVVRTLGSVGQADLGPIAALAHGLLERSGF